MDASLNLQQDLKGCEQSCDIFLKCRDLHCFGSRNGRLQMGKSFDFRKNLHLGSG